MSILDVSDDTLAFLGYMLVAEEGETKIYSHFGDEMVVDKSDPFILVDDINDVGLIKGAGEVIATPAND